MKKSFQFFCLVTALVSFTLTQNRPSAQAEVIVLAAPPSDSAYYEAVEEDIFAFHVAYAKQIAQRDQVLVLADDHWYPEYVAALGADKVALAPMLDIWMRDFTLSNTTHPVMFRYTAAAQGGGRDGQDAADAVQEHFAALLEKAGLVFSASDLLNDGGNFVDDFAGHAVLSTKFLKDNHLSEQAARARLTALPGLDQVAFIALGAQSALPSLEHADGVVSFIDRNTLLINSDPDNPAFIAQLKADLRRGLPEVEIHEIVTPYSETSSYDTQFESACGLYTNALVTPERLYLPQFGVPEDQKALEQVRALTDKEVIPVMSQGVCGLGGGVRCLSWQLRGKNAEMFMRFFQRRVLQDP